MKVLVTGGAGFIGSHIVDKLLAHDCQVAVVDDLSTGRKELVNPKAAFFQLDVAGADLTGLFAAEKFDYVIHQAAQTAVPRSLATPDFDCRVNVWGTVRLLEACRQTGVKRIVFASSAAVYGNNAAVPLTEDACAGPQSFYGLSKLTVERYLSLYRELFGLEYVILRYANVYGERQGDAGEGGVISIFARRIAGGRPIQIFGDGGQTRDFVYVRDVAAANYQALGTDHPDRVYNISTCTETSIRELAALLGSVAGREVEREYLDARAGDIYRSSLDNHAACELLNWRPTTALEDGLAATYRFVAQ
ncbi:MAG TPA: NAD-dependent epimerase/dehydratase family protein [Selenomonadales bacterium]|nr:NAD-dependent epimerase/dehydratase family protein [Selenomonadales bacterium]